MLSKIFLLALFILVNYFQQEAIGDYIPEAFTDKTPSAAVFGDRLYIAFKDNDSEQIRLASTDRPEDPSSWEIRDLTIGFSEPGPTQIRTSDGPAMSAFGNKLWLIFKGHNNANIWVIRMENGTWYGHGYIKNTQTAKAPAMVENLIVHRGNVDNNIWYTYHSVRPTPPDTRISSARSDDSPAVAYWTPENQKIVVYRQPNNAIMATRYEFTKGGGWVWRNPEQIPGVWSLNRPDLAMHGNLLYMAFRSRTNSQIWIDSYDGYSWILHGAIPDHETSEGPTLVSFKNRLYVVYKGRNSDRVWYGEVPISVYQREPRARNSKSFDIELGDAIYNRGNTSHGHAGVWVGIWGNRTGDSNNAVLHADLIRSDAGQFSSSPQAEGYVGYIEVVGSQTSGGSSSSGSSGGEGSGVCLMNSNDRKTISWSDAFANNQNGDLNTLASTFYSNWVEHSLDNFKRRGYLGAAASQPDVVTGSNRRTVVNAAYRVQRERPDYCLTDILKPKDGHWNKRISDIQKIRCDGVVEVAWDFSGFDASCKRNLFGDGDGDRLLEIHNVCFEICPVIQGYCVGTDWRHTNSRIGDSEYSWSEITNMRHGYHGIPYIHGNVCMVKLDNHIDFRVPIADYGSDVLYVTIAARNRSNRLELFVQGSYNNTNFDIEDEYFFKKVDLTNTFKNHDRTENRQSITLSWHGAIIGNGYRYIRQIDDFISFHILLVDASGNYQIYSIDNPF